MINHQILLQFIQWYNEENELSFPKYLKNKFGELGKFAAFVACTTEHSEVQIILKQIKMLHNSCHKLNQFSYNQIMAKPEEINEWYNKELDRRISPLIPTHRLPKPNSGSNTPEKGLSGLNDTI